MTDRQKKWFNFSVAFCALKKRNFMDLRIAKAKFNAQRAGAKKRGIEWKLTFDQWVEWWGADLANRGSRAYNLQMQRYLDQGPYALGNIKKGTPKENSKTYQNCLRTVLSQQAAERVSAACDACDPQHSADMRDDDDEELDRMFGIRNSSVMNFVG